MKKLSPNQKITVAGIALTALLTVGGWFFYNQTPQNHSGSGDNVIGGKVTNNFNYSESSEIKEVDHELVKFTYREPILFHGDTCNDGICVGEYIVIGENADTIRMDSRQCIEFKPTSYRYDTGPYDSKTGSSTKLISDWSGIEVRTCGRFDLSKSQMLSSENILYKDSMEKKIDNYNTYKSDGSIIVQ